MKAALTIILTLSITANILQHANECALLNEIVEQRKEIAALNANVARLQGDSLRMKDDYKYLMKRK